MARRTTGSKGHHTLFDALAQNDKHVTPATGVAQRKAQHFADAHARAVHQQNDGDVRARPIQGFFGEGVGELDHIVGLLAWSRLVVRAAAGGAIVRRRWRRCGRGLRGRENGKNRGSSTGRGAVELFARPSRARRASQARKSAGVRPARPLNSGRAAQVVGHKLQKLGEVAFVGGYCVIGCAPLVAQPVAPDAYGTIEIEDGGGQKRSPSFLRKHRSSIMARKR